MKTITQPYLQAYCQSFVNKCVFPTHGLTDRIKHENTTRYIKHLADSANFKDVTLKNFIAV